MRWTAFYSGILFLFRLTSSTFSDLADALGGVEVTLDQDYPDIGSKGDTITLEGNNVRLYLQNRKQMDDGEMSRQKHEQDFMMAIAKKSKSWAHRIGFKAVYTVAGCCEDGFEPRPDRRHGGRAG